MKIRVWKSFSSNNSSSFHIVARFATAQLAEQVADELREFFEAHSAEPGNSPLSVAMVELAIAHDFEWGEVDLGWAEDWQYETGRLDVDGDRVLIYHPYCLGIDGIKPYLEARDAEEISGQHGEPRLAVLFRLAENGHAAQQHAALEAFFAKAGNAVGPWGSALTFG
jgi:hypothetical protein